MSTVAANLNRVKEILSAAGEHDCRPHKVIAAIEEATIAWPPEVVAALAIQDVSASVLMTAAHIGLCLVDTEELESPQARKSAIQELCRSLNHRIDRYHPKR